MRIRSTKDTETRANRGSRRGRVHAKLIVPVIGALLLCTNEKSNAQSVEDLQNLSIDDLSNVKIYSVSKTAQPLSDAAAAIYVISHEDIRRSGATSLPEILRLAPNLEVAQVSGGSYAITARGFNGTSTSNGAGNKLLVLIDGRSVYTPLYAGVFWELQYVLPEDIDRIEVISGPGAALWGANAVNGVINIVTRNSADTQGEFVSAGAGNLERDISGRFGGRIGLDTTFRLYGTADGRGADETTADMDAHDGIQRYQGGFRVDWHPDDTLVTVQGDIFRGREDQALPPNAVIGGQNLLTRWSQPLEGGTLQLQAYYDFNTIYIPGGLGDSLTTYDVDVQDNFRWGTWQEFVWGGGARFMFDDFSNIASIQFIPPKTTQNLENAFIQDTISVDSDVKLIVGTKFENDPFVGLQTLPSARISWKATDTSLLWTGVSRAVRAPSLWDRDLNELSGGFTVLSGGDFRSEELTAYEAGYRAQPLTNLSFSLSTFYNVYSDLRSVEFSPGPAFPLVYGNMMEGETYGVEFWGSYHVTDWWLLSPGFNVQHEDLRFKPGSSMLLGTQAAGDDPNHQMSLRSAWDLPHNVQFDIDARYIGVLPNPLVPAYVSFGSRVDWHAMDHLDLVLSGANLGGAHREFGTTAGGIVVGPSFLLTLQWRS